MDSWALRRTVLIDRQERARLKIDLILQGGWGRTQVSLVWQAVALEGATEGQLVEF